MSFSKILSHFYAKSKRRLLEVNQKEIEAAAIMMQLFLTGLAFNFDATFHELEEVAKRALLQIERR